MRRAERQRHVGLEASFNFRDLGGYRTADGQELRWGAVYRSDSLQWLTARDARVLMDLGLRTIVDLRSSFEVVRNARSTHLGPLIYEHVPFFEYESRPFKPFEPGDPVPVTGEFYLTLAAACGSAIRTALHQVATGEHALVFHCAQGKDRTGILSAILLGALGVPEETIVADYALSERAVKPTLAWAQANEPDLHRELMGLPPWMLEASSEFMAVFLDRLRQAYGSLDGYLEEIGVGRQVVVTLRDRLLVDPDGA